MTGLISKIRNQNKINFFDDRFLSILHNFRDFEKICPDGDRVRRKTYTLHYVQSKTYNSSLQYAMTRYIHHASGTLKFWKSTDSFSYKLACVEIPYSPGLYDRVDFQNLKSKRKHFFWKFRTS